MNGAERTAADAMTAAHAAAGDDRIAVSFIPDCIGGTYIAAIAAADTAVLVNPIITAGRQSPRSVFQFVGFQFFLLYVCHAIDS